MTRRRLISWIVPLLCGLAAGNAGGAVPAGADSLARTAPRIGLYVFIASQADVEAAVPPGELRDFIEGSIGGNLRREGFTVLGTQALLPYVSRHRVRTSLLADREFLADLAGHPDLDRLILADLLILPNNLILALRELTVTDGMLSAMRLAEIDLAESDSVEMLVSTADRWRYSLARLCADPRLNAVVPRAARADTLAVLPFHAPGTDKVAALAASFMLMREILADSTIALPDPSLVTTSLNAAGLDTHLLNAEGRSLLRQNFSRDRLLQPFFVSYGSATPGFVGDVPDFDGSPHQEILLDSGVLSLWTIELSSGELMTNIDHYFELRRETGWFGIPDDRSPVIQLEAAIVEIWHRFAQTMIEES